MKKQSKERYHNDPEYKKATLERAKKRYYEDEEYKAATLRRANERYRRKRVKQLLARFFRRNGYFRIPDKKLHVKLGEDYKRGYEVRLVANDRKELKEINSLLTETGFKTGKPFKKNNKYVQPVYGKESVQKFKSILNDKKLKR